ncbi:hypothetical protein PM082_003035 [Marasmius tenuissimus]|nr:hypothetical protein PM082_003035 [Marasmius tenuissimus]
MRFASVPLLLACYASVVHAHFRLQFPQPRGEFVAQKELDFCGGYPEAVSNRSSFPLSKGSFSISTGHTNWVVGVILSTSQNPRTWEDFYANGQQQLVRDYAKSPDAGTYCIPLDLSSTGIADVKDGANVTIQVVFAGGDGNLYQCADLTLSNSATVPPCSNMTATTSGSSPTSSSDGSSGSNNGGVTIHCGAFFTFATCLISILVLNGLLL